MSTTPRQLAGRLPTGGPVDERRGIEALYATGHWLLGQERPADAASVFRAMALLASADERAWLGLGACHEALDQPELALEMYRTGEDLARPTVRCSVARARVFRATGEADEAEACLVRAADAAESIGDEALHELVASERRRP